MSNFEDVKTFMETFGQMVRTKPQFPDEKTMSLRFDLIKEELNELETAMKEKNLVAKNRTTIKRFMKTADGTWVSPMLYFRGGKNTKQSKKQNELVGKFNKLIEQYTTVQNSK